MKNNIVYYSIINKNNIMYDDTSNKLETKLARIVLKNMLEYFGFNLPKIYLSENGKPYFKDSKISRSSFLSIFVTFDNDFFVNE